MLVHSASEHDGYQASDVMRSEKTAALEGSFSPIGLSNLRHGLPSLYPIAPLPLIHRGFLLLPESEPLKSYLTILKPTRE